MQASNLEFCLQLAKGIARQFGPNCEVVVHDLASNDPETSIVAIENGHVSGRRVGDGPSHVVLEALRDSPLYRGFVEAFQSTVGQEVAEATSHAVRAVADYIAVQIARMVLFLLAFVAILVVWLLLSHALDLVARLPVLNGLNRWGGAAAGPEQLRVIGDRYANALILIRITTKQSVRQI